MAVHRAWLRRVLRELLENVPRRAGEKWTRPARTGSVTKARARLGAAPLRWLFDQVAGVAESGRRGGICAASTAPPMVPGAVGPISQPSMPEAVVTWLRALSRATVKQASGTFLLPGRQITQFR
nr:transposase domain-containing protein [Kitasatospora azatica]